MLDDGLVRVARDYNANTRSGRLYVELGKIMDCLDVRALELEELGFAKGIGPCTFVVVATHRRDRCDRSQLGEYVRGADVAAMHDVLAAAQES